MAWALPTGISRRTSRKFFIRNTIMKKIYDTSTFLGTLLFVLIIVTTAIQVTGSFFGLAYACGLNYIIPVACVAMSLIVAPVVHRRIFKPAE